MAVIAVRYWSRKARSTTPRPLTTTVCVSGSMAQLIDMPATPQPDPAGPNLALIRPGGAVVQGTYVERQRFPPRAVLRSKQQGVPGDIFRGVHPDCDDRPEQGREGRRRALRPCCRDPGFQRRDGLC